MDIHKHFLLLGFIGLMIVWWQPAKAQYAYKEPATAAYITPAPTYKLERPKRTPNKKADHPSVEVYRHHRRLSATYSGQFIQLIQTERPLPRDHELFRQFGAIYYDLLPDGQYIYGLKVDFSSLKSMLAFLERVVRPRAAAARLVVYKRGRLKTKN